MVAWYTKIISQSTLDILLLSNFESKIFWKKNKSTIYKNWEIENETKYTDYLIMAYAYAGWNTLSTSAFSGCHQRKKGGFQQQEHRSVSLGIITVTDIDS